MVSTSDTSGTTGTTDTSGTTALKPDTYRYCTPPVGRTCIGITVSGTTAGTSYNSFYNKGLDCDYVTVVSVVSPHTPVGLPLVTRGCRSRFATCSVTFNKPRNPIPQDFGPKINRKNRISLLYHFLVLLPEQVCNLLRNV
jgi:hypothetical protein